MNRFEVYLVNLDPTVDVEIRKTRPCLVVSPDEINHRLGRLDGPTSAAVPVVLCEMFAP